MKTHLQTLALLITICIAGCNSDNRLSVTNNSSSTIEARSEIKTASINETDKAIIFIMDLINLKDPDPFNESIRLIFTDLTANVDNFFKLNQPDEIKNIASTTTSIFYSEQNTERKALIYFPGGGYNIPAIQGHTQFANSMRKQNNVDLFISQYTLADKAPYPAALNDALAVYNYVTQDLNYPPENISIAGDSAGGNLTLALLLKLRDLQLPMPAAAVLLSPWADMSHTAPSVALNKDKDVMLSKNNLDAFTINFLQGSGISTTDARVSPVFADLKDLPPLLIFASTEEILLDDSKTLYQNAKKARVPVRFLQYQETNGGHVPHGWMALLTGGELADDVLFEISDFLKRYAP